MTTFAVGDIVAYNPANNDDPAIRESNARALKGRIGLVWRIIGAGRPVGVKWTGYCHLDHAHEHLLLVRKGGTTAALTI